MAPLTETMTTTIAPARIQMLLDGQSIVEEINFDSLPSGWRQIPAMDVGQKINLKALMDDEAIIQELVAIRGIGRWTAEMFLIFHLMRPNVLPLDDLGLLRGISVKDVRCWKPR